MAVNWSQFKPVKPNRPVASSEVDWSAFRPLPNFSNVQGGFQQPTEEQQFVNATETPQSPWPEESPDQSPNPLTMIPRRVAGGALTGLGGLADLVGADETGRTLQNVGALASDTGQLVERPEDFFDLQTIPYLAEQGVGGMAEFAGAMLAPGGVAGRVAATTGTVFGANKRQLYEEAVEQYLQEDLSPEEVRAAAEEYANTHALAKTAYQTPLEFLPFSRILGRGTGSAASNILRGTAEETGAELATYAADVGYDVGVRGQEAPTVGEFIREAAESAGAGAAGGGVLAGGVEAAGRLRRTGVPAFDAGLESVTTDVAPPPTTPETPITDSPEAVSPPTPTPTTPEASEAIVERSRSLPEQLSNLEPSEIANALEVLDPSRGRRAERTTERVAAEGQVVAQMLEEGSQGNNNRFAELMAERGFSTPVVPPAIDTAAIDEALGAVETEAPVAEQATNVAPEATDVSEADVVSETNDTETSVDVNDPLAFLDEAPSNAAARVAARGEVVNEMAEEGWTGSQSKRRAEMARRMTERGFPEEAAPDATARTDRPKQRAPIQANEPARVQRNNQWVDATVVETDGEDAVVQFNDGETAVKPVQEVERRERSPSAPVSVGKFRDVIRQLREEGRVGDKDRFNELMGEGPLDSLELTPAESAAFDRMFEQSRQAKDDSDLLKLTAEIGRREAKTKADEKGISKAVESITSETGITTVYASSLDDLDGIVLPEVLGRTRGLDDKRVAAGSKAVRKGTYYRATDTVDGKPLVVVYPDNANNVQEAVFTAAHELAGHHGVRSLIAKGDVGKYNTLMERLLANPVVAQVAASMGEKRKNGNKLLMAEEALSDLAAAIRTGDYQRIKDRHGVEVPQAMQSNLRAFIDRIVNALKNLIGKGVGFSDGQVRKIIEDSWKAATESNTDSDNEVLDSAEPTTTTTPRASIAPQNDAERILMTQRGPDSRWAKRRASANRLMKGLLSPYGVQGREVEMIRQNEVRGRINEGLYLAGVPANRLAIEAKKAGLKNGDVVRALRSGDLSSLPETVRTLAETLKTELQSLQLAAIEERLASRPADQQLTKGEMKAMMRALDSAFQLPEVYRKDIDPNYATSIIRDYRKNKLSPDDRKMVEDAMNDTMAQVVIPHDLSKRVDDGLIGRSELVDYHRKWVGTNIQGKSINQLTDELNNTRDLFIKEAGSEDAVAMWALNSMMGENPPGRMPSALFMNSRYDLTQGDNIPASVRKLWGEVDDVVINVQHAWAQAAAELGQYRMMNTIAAKWESEGKASKAPSGDNTMVLEGKGFGALNGMYVSPSRYDSIASVAEMYNKSLSVNEAILRGEKEFTNTLLQGASKATRMTSGFLKANAIIGNMANWYFNVIGSPETIISSGNIKAQGFKEGIQGISGTALLGARKETNPYTAELIRNGITESAQVGEIANLLRNAKVRRLAENSRNLTSLFSGGLQLVRTGALETTNLYSLMDLWAPAVTYFKNKQDLKGFWDRTGREYTEQELQRETADMTKNSTVTMSYIPQLVRMMEGHGLSYVLPYIVAAHRAMGFNTYLGGRQIVEGLKAGDKDYALVGLMRTIGNASMAASFFARMSPFYALGTLPFVAAGNAISYLIDSDDEEEKAVLQSIRQDDRLKLSNPAVVHKGEDGTYYVIDINRVLVNEPGLLTAEVATKAVTDFLSGDATGPEAAKAVLEQLGDQVFANASMVRLFKGITNPAGQSAFRREARELYDTWIGDSGTAQRIELGAEIALPKNITTMWNELAKDASGKSSPERLATLKRMGFPIYEINPARDAGGDNYFMGSKRFNSDYNASRKTLKDSVGLLTNIPDNKLEAAYIEFARTNLEAFGQALPTINAAHLQGADAGELDQRMKDNGLSIPKNTREALAEGRFELPEISDSFFKGELRLIEDEALKYNNPEEKLDEWTELYSERLERLRDIRDIVQEAIDEGSFK